MNDKLIQIIKTYGVEHQKRKLCEECSELRDAVTEYELITSSGVFRTSDETAALNHIIEEIADVQVVLNQFKLFYRVYDEDIVEEMMFKVNRTIDRMENEKESEENEVIKEKA